MLSMRNGVSVGLSERVKAIDAIRKTFTIQKELEGIYPRLRKSLLEIENTPVMKDVLKMQHPPRIRGRSYCKITQSILLTLSLVNNFYICYDNCMPFDPHHLRRLRTKLGFSQEHIAKEIGLSRPTYLQTEKGERDLTVTEAQKLAGIFGMSLEDFLGGKELDIALPKLPAKQRATEEKSDMRINVPQERMDKFREILLYILQKVGAKPNVGETVLYKILYFIDFDFYEKFEEQLMGLKYIKNHHGPSPTGFTQMVAQMEKDGDLVQLKSKYFQYDQKKYLPRREPDLSKIDARELQHIDTELGRFSSMNAAQIREYSHGDIPWKVHKMGEQLEYEYAFYREPPYSMRIYDPL